MEKRIVIGCNGEIGRAICNIFKATIRIDKDYVYLPALNNRYGKTKKTIMHICIPYTDNFVRTVVHYADIYTPDIVIIHTTCAIGTTRKIDKILSGVATIVHASVNCRHPNTESDILKYNMFVGALNERDGNEACDYIERFGLTTYLCDTPESSEFNKIASTEYCKTMVEFFGYLKELADNDSKLNWKECIAYFENLMHNNGEQWKRVYRRGDRIDTLISGKHCLNSNNRLWEKYLIAQGRMEIF